MSVRPPDFDREGRSWPFRDASRFVVVEGQRLHAQVIERATDAAAAPVILLLHGTGAGVHSFRDLVPLLTDRFTVVAFDLPGHGFSTTLPATGSGSAARSGKAFSPSPSGTASLIAHALKQLDLDPDVVVGHSAGAAVAVCLVLAEEQRPVRVLVGLSAALVPIEGFAAVVLPAMARLAARAPLLARFVAWRARQPGSVERLVRSTGSTLDATGIGFYRKLAGCPGHVAGVLRMLAHWDLDFVFDRLSLLEVKTLLVAGAADRAVPVADQRRASEHIEHARLIVVDGAGHLVHEERPAQIARLIHEAADAAGLSVPGRSLLEERP